MRRKFSTINRLVLVAALMIGRFAWLHAQVATTDDQRMAWWKEAKFGLFIHWGIYAVPAGVYQGKPIEGLGEWIMLRGKIPVATYKAYARQFNPINYNPDAWVRLAKDAGMKYIIITVKHHDGFALFDSKVTDWDVVDATPYGKDLLKPLAEACRRQGMKLGFYYSQAQDWAHPGGAAMFGGHWDKAQDGNMDEYLDRIAVPQVKEILTQYGDVAVLWWDTPEDMTPARAAKFDSLLAAHPQLVTNNRLGGGYAGDTETPEQFVPATGFPGRNWEACMTMNDTWGFKTSDTNWKSSETLIRTLTEVVSKGGNFLLNVGPTPAGDIPQASLTRLADMGKWLAVNHQAVYGTTASPFAYLPFGRCTRKDQKLYFHVFNYPANGELRLPVNNPISSAYLLANPAKLLPVRVEAGRPIIQLPRQAPDPVNTVVVVEFVGGLVITPSVTQGKSVVVSSQKSATESGTNLSDGNRLTRWVAAAGDRRATIDIDLGKPTTLSCFLVDEPWHSWDNRHQDLELFYKEGNGWKAVTQVKTNGSGHVQSFTAVKAQFFRLVVANPDTEPVLSEWQLYGPD